MTTQQRVGGASALDGEFLYDVSVLIPQIGGATPEDAAETFWAILEDYREGKVGPIFITTARLDTRALRQIELDPRSGLTKHE